jgi:3-dehydroquinate dehydratase II
MMSKILVINGPNLNFLGIREKSIYGTQNYDALVEMIQNHAKELGVEAECWQSNHEGAIIDRLQAAYFEENLIGVVINPGAYTHYSYAIHDALRSVFVPKVEIHISDINTREEFRKTSVTVPACDHQIVGHGLPGYLEAMDYIVGKRS